MAALSEHAIQAAYFDWARLHHTACRAFAIPNGGKRGKATAGKLKAEGVRAGVLDVFLPVPSCGFAGLWIEFKAGDNDLTSEQAAEAARLANDGYAVAVARDTIAAILHTKAYLCSRVADLTFL